MPQDWDGNSPFDFDMIFGSIARNCHLPYSEIASQTPRQTFGHFLGRHDEDEGEPRDTGDPERTVVVPSGRAPWLAHPSWQRTAKELEYLRQDQNPDLDPTAVPREQQKERFYVQMAHLARMGQLEGLKVTDSGTGEVVTKTIRPHDMDGLRDFCDWGWAINERNYPAKLKAWEEQNGISCGDTGE